MNVYRITLKLILCLKKTILSKSVLFLLLVILVSSNFYSKDEKIGVLLINDDANTVLTKHFECYMEKYVHFIKVSFHKKNQLEQVLFYDKEKCTLQIPSNFTSDFLKKKKVDVQRRKFVETHDSILVDMLVSKYLSVLQSKQGLPLNQVLREMDEELSETVILSCIDKKHTKEEKFGMLANYLAYALFSIILPYTVFVLFHLKKEGISNYSKMWPINVSAMFRQALEVCIGVGVVFGSIMLIIGGGLIQIDFRSPNVWMIFINVLNCTIYCVAIGAFIGMIIKEIKNFDSQAQLVIISFLFLSGVFVRQDKLPENITSFAKYIPTYLYVSINDNWCKAEVLKFHNYQTFAIQEGMMFCISVICLLVALIIGEKKIKWDI